VVNISIFRYLKPKTIKNLRSIDFRDEVNNPPQIYTRFYNVLRKSKLKSLHIHEFPYNNQLTLLFIKAFKFIKSLSHSFKFDNRVLARNNATFDNQVFEIIKYLVNCRSLTVNLPMQQFYLSRKEIQKCLKFRASFQELFNRVQSLTLSTSTWAGSTIAYLIKS